MHDHEHEQRSVCMITRHLKHGVVDHFILRTDYGVDLFTHHHRVRVSLIINHAVTHFQRRVVTLHNDSDSRHHVATRAFLYLVRCHVANLGVDLIDFVGSDHLWRRRQWRQAVPHSRVVRLQLDTRRYLQHTG